MFQLYLTELLKRLILIDPFFRENSVILLDNASYHCHVDVLRHIKFLGLTVIFSGPYSYSAAPAELYFAYFKAGQLIPDGVPTGKKSLDQVKERVLVKARTIKRANVTMFCKSSRPLLISIL